MKDKDSSANNEENNVKPEATESNQNPKEKQAKGIDVKVQATVSSVSDRSKVNGVGENIFNFNFGERPVYRSLNIYRYQMVKSNSKIATMEV